VARLVGLVTIGVLLALVLRWAIRDIRRIAATRPRSVSTGDRERHGDRRSRRRRESLAPEEDRRGILDFLESREGVEAFVEPRTTVSGLSVVLVAHDGEWTRFSLRDDAFLRELAESRGLRVYDAGNTGYPERMRRYRRGNDRPPDDTP
jgi:hypothetical protein